MSSSVPVSGRIKTNHRAVPGAGFSAKLPIFPSVAKINLALGKTGQFILVNELATRELGEVALIAGVESHITSIAKKHGVRVSLSDFSEVTSELPNWYTMLTFTAVDRAFRQLIREIKKYKNPSNWIDKGASGNLGALEQLDANQPDGQKRISSYAEYHVLEYYRLVRNSWVHPASGSGRDILSNHARLGSYSRYLKDNYQTRGAPNLHESLKLDDFFLHARIARDFSTVISDAYCLTYGEILAVFSADSSALNRARAAGGGRQEAFRNACYDYYFKNHQRWNDDIAVSHAHQFADLALEKLG